MRGLVAVLIILAVVGRRTVQAPDGTLTAPLLPEASGALNEVALRYVPKSDALVDAPSTEFLRAIARIEPTGVLAKRVSVVESPGPITSMLPHAPRAVGNTTAPQLPVPRALRVLY